MDSNETNDVQIQIHDHRYNRLNVNRLGSTLPVPWFGSQSSAARGLTNRSATIQALIPGAGRLLALIVRRGFGIVACKRLLHLSITEETKGLCKFEICSKTTYVHSTEEPTLGNIISYNYLPASWAVRELGLRRFALFQVSYCNVKNTSRRNPSGLRGVIRGVSPQRRVNIRQKDVVYRRRKICPRSESLCSRAKRNACLAAGWWISPNIHRIRVASIPMDRSAHLMVECRRNTST